MAAVAENEATTQAGDSEKGSTAVEPAPSASNDAPGGESGPGSSSVEFQSPSPDEHLLQNKYTFWYMKRGNKSAASQAESYEQQSNKYLTLQVSNSFGPSTVTYSAPRPAGQLMDYIMFNGIKLVWEDESNKKGEWVVRIPKRLSAYYWESLLLAIIGEQFDVVMIRRSQCTL